MTSQVHRNMTAMRSTCPLVLLMAIAMSTGLFAQTAGDPVVYSSGTLPSGLAATTSYIDAFTATGGSGGISDICSRINTAWGMVLGTTPTSGSTPPAVNSVTVDARGFTGAWTCGSSSSPESPFSPTGTSLAARGVLLLGNAIITTYGTWTITSQTSLIGMGTGNTTVSSTNGINTVIRAGASFSSSSPAVLQMGASSGGPWFGIVIRDLIVDCHGETGCVGIFNNESEENSFVEHVQIWDAPAYGLHVSAYNASDSSDSAATNSGPYRNIYIAFTANCGSACNSAVGVQVDGPGTQSSTVSGSRVIRQFDDITVTGHATEQGYLSGAGAVIYGVSTAFTNSHIEYATTGIEIGDISSCSLGSSAGNCNTDGVEVSNVSIGTLTGGSGQTAVILGNTTSGAPTTYDVSLMGIANQASGANTLIDDTTPSSPVTLSYANDPFIGLYAVGRPGIAVVKNTK